ncbi:MAG: hypothetical protein IT246_10600 [Bacteroidia bacterium]|nr:hypothetical protein [Bacteroidia bacterium]
MEIHIDISDEVHRIPCIECGETIIVSEDELKSKSTIKCERCGHEQLIVNSNKNDNE